MRLFNERLKMLHYPVQLKKELKRDGMILLIGLMYYIWYAVTTIGVPCIILKNTGLYCSGCGMTRMIVSLAHFDIRNAWRYNPFVLTLLPYGAFLYIRNKKYLLTKGYRYQYKKYHIYISIFIGICGILFGIIRNLSDIEFLRP